MEPIRLPDFPDDTDILIAGGGPAGLEAARTAALRGHSVVLCEKSDVLGGNFIRAAKAEFKEDLKKYLKWSIRTISDEANIDIRMNTEVTRELVEKESPCIPKASVLPHTKIITVPAEGNLNNIL